MKITYVGCKSKMYIFRQAFTRGATVDVSDQLGNKLLEVDGFFAGAKLTPAAKADLAFNADREKLEKEKLKKGFKLIVVPDKDLKSAYQNLLSENELLTSELEALKDGSEIRTLVAELEEAHKKIAELENGSK